MALGPNELHQKTETVDQPLLTRMEKTLDAKMAKIHWEPGKKVNFTFPRLWPGAPDKLHEANRAELEARYRRAGWLDKALKVTESDITFKFPRF